MVIILASTLTVAGCVCVYLASPNQKWLAQTPPGKPLLATGALLLAAGLATWIAELRPLIGFFVTLHVAMACLFALPYIAALRAAWREN